jgi:Predicted hydrolase (metallo-beta-lactamase superfamily)
MSLVKSFSVGNGDMFLVEHDSDSITFIDCCLPEEASTSILDELRSRAKPKGISRFISTHPDEDHLRGLSELDRVLPIVNFYCVQNRATKSDATADFKKYCALRDSEKAFHVAKGCTRKWLNQTDDTRRSAGLSFLWPDTTNAAFKAALADAAAGLSPNNISPVLKYSCGGATFLWMGDLETSFMDDVADALDLPSTTVLFAPHHGRDSGRVPSSLLDQMSPSVIVIGEAPSSSLNYYAGYNTITQNSAGNISFQVAEGFAHVFVGEPEYTVDFLEDRGLASRVGSYYIGSVRL